MYLKPTKYILSIGAILVSSQLLAESYQINIVYNPASQQSISQAQLQATSVQGGSSFQGKQAKIMSIEPSPALQQEIEQYVKDNIYVSSEKFKQIYGASPEAFRLASIISKQNKNIKYAFPVGAKSNTFSSISNDPNEYKGMNVTQWYRQAWDMGPSTSISYGIDVPGAWSYLTSRSLSTIYIAVIDNGIAPNAPYDFRSRLDYTNSYNFYDDGGNQEVEINKDIYSNPEQTYHGTHVGGTIFANGPNVTGVVGPLNEAKAYELRAIQNGSSEYSSLVAELWAVNQHKTPGVLDDLPYLVDMIDNPHPAKVLNMSYGSSRINEETLKPTMSMDAWIEDFFIYLCQAAQDSNYLVNATGAVQVIAAGNDYSALINDTPSGCPNIKS